MYSVCVNLTKFENLENQKDCYLFFVRSGKEAQSTKWDGKNLHLQVEQ